LHRCGSKAKYKLQKKKTRILLHSIKPGVTKNRTAHTARGALTACVTKHRTARNETPYFSALRAVRYFVTRCGVS